MVPFRWNTPLSQGLETMSKSALDLNRFLKNHVSNGSLSTANFRSLSFTGIKSPFNLDPIESSRESVLCSFREILAAFPM